jgi:hypothetical protein
VFISQLERGENLTTRSCRRSRALGGAWIDENYSLTRWARCIPCG